MGTPLFPFGDRSWRGDKGPGDKGDKGMVLEGDKGRFSVS